VSSHPHRVPELLSRFLIVSEWFNGLGLQLQPIGHPARFQESGYYHLANKPKAYALAGAAVKDHPNCALAHAIRIRSAPAGASLAELEASVPEAVREEVEILHALGWFALSSGDMAAAERFARFITSLLLLERLRDHCWSNSRIPTAI
jgi:hypothetical protein